VNGTELEHDPVPSSGSQCIEERAKVGDVVGHVRADGDIHLADQVCHIRPAPFDQFDGGPIGCQLSQCFEHLTVLVHGDDPPGARRDRQAGRTSARANVKEHPAVRQGVRGPAVGGGWRFSQRVASDVDKEVHWEAPGWFRGRIEDLRRDGPFPQRLGPLRSCGHEMILAHGRWTATGPFQNGARWAELLAPVSQDPGVPAEPWGWPQSDEELIELQGCLRVAAASALATDPWLPPGERPVFGGCFVVYARGGTGPGRCGDRAWAAAVAWRGDEAPDRGSRRTDRHLRGAPLPGCPRRADDVVAQNVVTARARAPYVPGLLARREGPVLAAALAGLEVRPALVLVDASGLDHPRGAGLAVHLGAIAGVPTVGVTRRPLMAAGDQPELRRGAVAPLQLDGHCVAFWVCTRTGAQPLVAHSGWRTSPETAVRVVLEASTPAARSPVPLQEARRVAREARGCAWRG